MRRKTLSLINNHTEYPEQAVISWLPVFLSRTQALYFLFIAISMQYLLCFYFSIFEMNFRIRKRERFESSLVRCKSVVKALFSSRRFCSVCDFVCSKISLYLITQISSFHALLTRYSLYFIVKGSYRLHLFRCYGIINTKSTCRKTTDRQDAEQNEGTI